MSLPYKADSTSPLRPAAPKFAKIQPAIAIKPKPALVPVQTKSTFNPRYDPKTSASSFLQDETAATPAPRITSPPTSGPTAASASTPGSNINTLRQWVLPPRPRPGRKPSSAQSLEEKKQILHKKHKASRRAEPVLEIAESPLLQSSIPCDVLSPLLASSQSVTLSARALQAASVSPSSPGATTPTDRVTKIETGSRLLQGQKQVTDLQETYLSRLKEQELVHNYIDILTSQIKELKFVQSGVITFDALDSNFASRPRASASLLPAEQLDHINNIRDLDAFLHHLTTQSKVIHSVTKKASLANSGGTTLLQQQIRHYLDLRASHSAAGTRSAAAFARSNGMGLSSVGIKSTAMHPTISDPTSLISQRSVNGSYASENGGNFSGRRSSLSMPGLTFTPSLLRPLNMNLFDQDDGILNVDIISDFEGDLFSTSAAQEKRDDGEEVDMLSQKPTVAQPRLGRKPGCGFCNGETPCLCFDADNVFGER